MRIANSRRSALARIDILIGYPMQGAGQFAALALTPRDRIFALAGLRLTRTYRSPGLSLARHSHEHTNVGLCVRGAFQETLQGRWHDIGPAVLISRPAGEPHSNRYGPRPACCLIFEILPAAWERIGTANPVFRRQVLLQSPMVAAIATRIDRELQTRDSLAPLAVESLFYELMVHAARQAMPGSGRRPGWLRTVRDMLHDQFLGELDLSRMAETVSVTPAHLSRTFRRHYRMTPGDYVRQLRLTYAVTLFPGGLPLSEISTTCGFYDQSHFSRAFKRRFGVPPAQFRKSLAVN